MCLTTTTRTSEDCKSDSTGADARECNGVCAMLTTACLLACRTHISNLQPVIDSGFLILGGAYIRDAAARGPYTADYTADTTDPLCLLLVLLIGALLERPPEQGESPKMVGSALIAQADSRAEVLTILENDVYAKSAVWDLSKVCGRTCCIKYS